jgi:hypothetical protein
LTFERLVAGLDVERLPRVAEILGWGQDGEQAALRQRIMEVLAAGGESAQRLYGQLFDSLPLEERGVLLVLIGEWLAEEDPPSYRGRRPWAARRAHSSLRTCIFKLRDQVIDLPLYQREVRYLRRLHERGFLHLSESGDWRRFMDLVCRLPDELLGVLRARYPALPLTWSDLSQDGLGGRLGAQRATDTNDTRRRPLGERLRAAAQDPRLPGPWPPPPFAAGGISVLERVPGPRTTALANLGAIRAVLEEHELGTVGVSQELEPAVVMVLLPEVYLHELKRTSLPDQTGHRLLADPGLRFLRHLDRLTRVARERPLRRTHGGTLYRRDIPRILGDEPGWELPFMREEESPLDLVVAAGQELKLVCQDEERWLRAQPQATQWPELGVAERLRQLVELTAHRYLAGTGGELPAPDPWALLHHGFSRGRWYPRAHLQHVARLDFQARPPANEVFPAVHFRWRFHDLERWVTRGLHPLGLLELRLEEDGRLDAFRPTHRLMELLNVSTEPRGPACRLVINPDFEALLFPGSGAEECALFLNRIARLQKDEAVRHFRIAADPVRQAALEGLDGARILERLQGYASTPIPGNVARALGEWGRGVHLVRYQELKVVRVDSPETLARLRQLREFREDIVEQLTPTTVVVRNFPTGSALRERLRREGIFLQA